MTKEDILNTLEQAKDYAERAKLEAKEAQDIASVAETQSIEAYHLVEKAIDMLEEYDNEN
jgi:hypothetical protein